MGTDGALGMRAIFREAGTLWVSIGLVALYMEYRAPNNDDRIISAATLQTFKLARLRRRP